VCKLKTTKDIWDSLVVNYEGNEDVQLCKYTNLTPPPSLTNMSLWKTKKRIRKGLRTRDELGSRLRVGKVLALHSACPKTVPLIK